MVSYCSIRSHSYCWQAIILFALTTLFSFITLPVEIDASKRALVWLSGSGITNSYNHAQAEDALRSAAYTYVVAATQLIGYVDLLHHDLHGSQRLIRKLWVESSMGFQLRTIMAPSFGSVVPSAGAFLLFYISYQQLACCFLLTAFAYKSTSFCFRNQLFTLTLQIE